MGIISSMVIIIFTVFDQLAMAHISIRPSGKIRTKHITVRVSFHVHFLEDDGGAGGFVEYC